MIFRSMMYEPWNGLSHTTFFQRVLLSSKAFLKEIHNIDPN